MKVIWDFKAKAGRDQIATYINRQFGRKRKLAFLQEVRQTTTLLKSNPYIGALDPLLANRSIPYRSIIINGLSKMVYNVKDETIRIAAFWDTRCEPRSQANNIK